VYASTWWGTGRQALHRGEDSILVVPGFFVTALVDGEIDASVYQETPGIGLLPNQRQAEDVLRDFTGHGLVVRTQQSGILLDDGLLHGKIRGFFEFFSIRNFIRLGILCIRNFVH